MSTRSICHAGSCRRTTTPQAAGPLGRSVLATALLCSAAVVQAGDCPLLREPRIPPVPEPVDLVDPINIDKVKTQLRDYHAGNYDYDAAAVLSDAYLRRAPPQGAGVGVAAPSGGVVRFCRDFWVVRLVGRLGPLTAAIFPYAPFPAPQTPCRPRIATAAHEIDRSSLAARDLARPFRAPLKN
jgi:hypothetical protein